MRPLLYATALLALTASSCLMRSQDDRSYYAFSSTSARPLTSQPSLRARVRSVSVPGYLERTELVSRNGRNQLKVYDHDLWGESLDKEIARNIAASLRHLLGSSQIVALDSRLTDHDSSRAIDIEISRFERDPRGMVVLTGLYAITPIGSKTPGPNRSFNITAPISPTGPQEDPKANTVAAMNSCLNQLSGRVARSLLR